jgi:DNA-binding CsgD family transcriptional regulator
VWDHERWLTIAARQVEVLRQAGALAALPVHLTYLGMATAWAGDLTHVAALVAEIDDVSAATGSHFPPYTLLRLRALESRPDEANPVIASAVSAGTGVTAARAHWADAVLHNGLGDYAGALAAAQRALAHASNHWLFGWVLPELVEAAARTANLDVATAATRELGRATAPAGTDEALGIQARCDALISDAPEALYLEAIERLSRTRLRPEMARAHLLYGEWLRRSGRRVDARRQLRAAYDTFAAVGMQAFADRARRELLATGEKVRRHTAEARDDLTGQERQIAMLAREGLSNSEIGARLFLSPRTVEWHLRNVFSKLDIRSRRQLRLALPTAD